MPYVYREVDEGIRARIAAEIGWHYKDLRVLVRSAARVEGRGIEIRGLSIVEPGVEDPREAMVHLEEVFLCCTTDLADLLTEEVAVGRIAIRRPTLRLIRRPDGTWNAQGLLPLPKLGRRAPEVTIENGTIELLDPTRDPPARYVLRDANLTIAPAEGAAGASGARTIRGTLTGDHLHHIEFEGTIDPERGTWQIAGLIEDLAISPDLCDALPAPVAAAAADFRGLRGRAEATFRLSNAPAPGEPCRFAVTASLTQGRVDDPRLPYPLTGILATIHANNDGFAIRNLSAQGGEGSLWLDGRRAGYAPDAPWALEAELRRLELNPQLLEVLPEKLQTLWRKYWPSGLIDAHLKLASDGQHLRPEATEIVVRCLDVAFTYHKFPYRVERAQGTLVLKNDEVAVDDLLAYTGDRPIRMSARVRQLFSGPSGWFEARGEAIPIDQKALDALQPDSRRVVDSLRPRGTCDAWLRVEQPRPGVPPTQHYVLTLNGCSICFDGFPYPLENVHGRLERFPDRSWAFTNLVGANDAGRITCEGNMVESAEGKVLTLAFTGTNVRLEEELRDALRPAMRQVWNDLKPRGAVNLDAELQWLVDRKKLNLTVSAVPQTENSSIEPKAFPYRLEKLHGKLVYRDGHVSVDRFQAEHGQVTVSCNGSCDFLPDGSWHVRLGDVAVDHLRLDRELIQALPARLRKGLVRLDPRGPADLHRGTFDFWHSGRSGEPVRAAWDLAIGFQQVSVECGVLLENMYGDLTLTGGFDGQRFQSRGELNVESLTFKGFQFTQVMGPFWIDDGRVLFGSWVDRPEGGVVKPGATDAPAPRSVTARLFDGTIEGDAWIALEQVPRYALTARLAQADLSLFAKETLAGQQDLRGRVGAEVELRGQGATVHGLGGRGRVWLREADVYQLPVMVALLKILSIREPDRSAFSSADIRFGISGPHVYLRPINFNGDAISLLGQGQMDFDTNIDLAFHAVVGRDAFRLPIVSPLMGEASRQTMTIKITGSLHNPQTSRQVLPGVKEALARLQADLQPHPMGQPPTSDQGLPLLRR
ncbi:MAG: AsmA-like C-terminal domain-containing protein [Pirellulales bacterium]|nr:AsmA-like C-terminal domain-containing protein [Pirellulales bacterium]